MTLHLTHLTRDVDVDSLVVHPVSAPLPATMYRRVFKRGMDTLLVLLAAPFVIPVVLLAALIVALDGGSPFYSQLRVGKDGRVFRMWKLRSMVPDADKKLEAHLERNPAARIEWNVTQKLKNDPRITRFGCFLRKTSMDELPQLLNVLKGDMALVGPRPMMVDQRSLYPGHSYERLRPGITGLWQISDRNECEFRDRARFDDAYDRDVSFSTDLSILSRTVSVVLRGTGY